MVNKQSIELSEKNDFVNSLKKTIQDFGVLNEEYEKICGELDQARAFNDDIEAKNQSLINLYYKIII